jgi:putative SOS response-associated peptidase YedK
VWRFRVADPASCLAEFGHYGPLVVGPGLTSSVWPDAEVICPTHLAPILRMVGKRIRIEMTPARWQFGLRPRLGPANKPARRKTFTVRAEALSNSQTYREAFVGRRCVVPATAWLECVRKKGQHTPWEFGAKGGGPIFFAGLWEEVEDHIFFVIVTEPAGPSLNGFGYRAPVVLWGDDRRTWLEPETPVSELYPLLGPESPDCFDARQITRPSKKSLGRRRRSPSQGDMSAPHASGRGEPGS